jgi:hypothetical protein
MNDRVNRVRIDGWVVAEAELETINWSRRPELPDRCWLFRSPTVWTLVTMRRSVRYDDYYDQLAAGTASIFSQTFATLDEVAQEVERTYNSTAWSKLVDAGHDHDQDLYRAWVPEQIARDFDRASIHRKDLALYSSLLGGEAVPAPGRQLHGWEAEAVDQLAAHLVTLGFTVLDERPAVDDPPDARGSPLLGALRVRRYGWETTGVVRIDAAGEVFISLDPDAVAGPLFQSLLDDDDEEWNL